MLSAFSNARALAHYDETLHLCLACDASELGGGHVLFQVEPGTEKPQITKTNIVAISSHKFNDVQQRYSVYKKELWSCVYGMRRHHHFLWGKQFTLIRKGTGGHRCMQILQRR